jgi:DNA-binding NtrC family response regulator
MMATYPQTAKEPAARSAREAARILAADDQPHILDAIELLLQPEGYRVTRAQSPREVRDRVASETFDALLIDLNYTRDTTSGAEGLELLAQLSAHDSRLRIIVMTAWANVDLAVESMRRGACDFVQKPWENARLISIVRTQIELRRAVRHRKSWRQKIVCCAPKGGLN